MRIVVAVGGNALIRAGQRGTWPEQLHNVRAIAEAVLALRAAGHEVVITHGNGPQVGALLLQNALGEPEAAALPLDALIAMTQGQIGYLLESAFAAIDPTVPIAVLLTRVLVDRADPAFRAPTKPVGPFYSAAEARSRARELGWDVAPDAGRGWRRVVPSPHPRKVFGEEHIACLLEHGAVVVACGGGGIPVAAGEDNVVGVAGVIDKDRCSARLAADIRADVLVLLTGVRRVALDFGTRWERELARLTVSDAARGLAEGDFPAGSMGPKMESAGQFVEESGGRALVTSAERLVAAVAGDDGTWIVPDAEGPSLMAEGAVWA
jgi:carbamate kinase